MRCPDPDQLLDHMGIPEDGPERFIEVPGPYRSPITRPGKLSNEQLRELHRDYLAGDSILDLAKGIWKSVGFASPRSGADAIYRGFKRLRLPIRTRLEGNLAAGVKRRPKGCPPRLDSVAYQRWRKEHKRALPRTSAGSARLHSGSGVSV